MDDRDFSLPEMLRVELSHEDILEWIRVNAQKLSINPKREVTADWSMSFDEAVAFESMLERIEDWFACRNEVPLAVLAVRKLLIQIPVDQEPESEPEPPAPKRPRQKD